MPIHLRANQYQGINAHLHSDLQAEEGGWGMFHAQHIPHLAEAIDAVLPDGYVVEPTFALGASAYMLIMEEASDALVIREVDERGQIGRPITWLELLSPTNKPPNAGGLLYCEKRAATIQTGLVLVEIDYLHETRSPIAALPSYPDGDAGAFAYSIVVTDPRPTLSEGLMAVYGVAVDEPLPTIRIPLASVDAIALDMQAVYERTFSSLATFSLRVDYEQLPRHFERYAAPDQKRIWTRMQAIQGA